MRRLTCLDGLRGALAFYVMLSHTLPFAPLPYWLLWLFAHGGAGVDVFFILSGLVIVQSLASFAYRPRPFLIARVARIYPVFLVVFVVALAVQPLGTGFERMAWIATRQPGALHLVGRLAARLVAVHRRTSDDDPRAVPGWRAAGRMGRLPRRGMEPVDRMAILPAGVADRVAPGAAVAGLAVPGAFRRGGGMACGGVGCMAVQPRLPAEQGAVFCTGHRQRDWWCGKAPEVWAHILECWPPRWCYLPPKVASTSCCHQSCGRHAWRHNFCPQELFPSPYGRG